MDGTSVLIVPAARRAELAAVIRAECDPHKRGAAVTAGPSARQGPAAAGKADSRFSEEAAAQDRAGPAGLARPQYDVGEFREAGT
jgi:hypothetical protein